MRYSRREVQCPITISRSPLLYNIDKLVQMSGGPHVLSTVWCADS